MLYSLEGRCQPSRKTESIPKYIFKCGSFQSHTRARINTMWLLQNAISIKLNVVYSALYLWFRLFQEPVKVLEQSSLSILYWWFVLKVVPILYYVVPVVSTLNISKRNIGQSSINPLLFTFWGPSRLLIYSWVSVDQRSNIARTKALRDTFTLSFESSELKVLDSSWRMFIIQGIEYYQKNWEKSCSIFLKRNLASMSGLIYAT